MDDWKTTALLFVFVLFVLFFSLQGVMRGRAGERIHITGITP